MISNLPSKQYAYSDAEFNLKFLTLVIHVFASPEICKIMFLR